MKIPRLIHRLNGNYFRWFAAICWFIGAALTLWTYQWQEHLDVNIRKHLIQQSEQAVKQINASLSASRFLSRRKTETEIGSEVPKGERLKPEMIAEIVSKTIDDMNLGAQSFAVLIAHSGEVLSYPDYRLLGESGSSSTLLSTIVNQFPRGELMTFDHPVTGKEQWMVKRYIPSLDANLGLIIDAEELREKKSISLWLGYLVTFFCLTGCIFLVSSWRFPSYENAILRRVYIVISLSLFSLLLILWNHALENIPLNEGETLLVDRESAELAWRRSQDDILETLDAVSSSIYLELHNIHLLNANEIKVSGLVLLPSHQEINPSIQIQYSLESSWRLQRQFDGRQLWHFVTKLKQSIENQSFPFDQDVLTLTLLPIENDKQLILMPLFQAYKSLAPNDFPGLLENFRTIGGWHIEQTYFTYQKEVLYPNQTYLGLKYNIAIQRSLTGPSISHIMPLCVVSFLTYCMLLLWTKDTKKQSLWGFSTATELQYSASLFFILVISHVALRDTLDAQGVVFIEYFYFLSYLQIIFIAMGSLLYTSKIEPNAVNQNKAALLQQWYWPCVLVLCILITLIFLK